MGNSCKVFGLLLYKNLLVRKRHWKSTIFLQGLTTVLLFLLMQAVRDFSAQSPEKFNETIYPIETETELLDMVSPDLPLYYFPLNSYTREIMEQTKRCLNYRDDNIIGYLTEDEMIDAYIQQQTRDPEMNVFAVVFDKYDVSQKNMKYNIRHSYKIPNNLFQDARSERLKAASMMYYRMTPFVQLQLCLDKAYISHALFISNETERPNEWLNFTKLSIQEMPYPPHIKTDEGDLILREMICSIAIISFLIPLCIEASFGAKEKFIGITVLMEMNGVKVYQNLLSWLITAVFFSIVYVIPIIVLFKNSLSGNVYPYLYYSNGFIFWLLLTLHIVHLTTFGMHVAAYFSRPAFVSTTLSVVYIAAVSLHGNLLREECYMSIPYLGILFPNMLFYRLLQEVNSYESKLIGIQWTNFFTVGDPEYGTVGSLGFIFIFSILGSILHFFLAVCINAVLPGKYGIRKHPFYFLKCVKRNKVSFDEEVADFDYSKVDNENFEAVSAGVLTPGIQIRNLKKTYITGWLQKSKVCALKGVTVDFYKGQITALLGHNGAGKTTLMSILTGVTCETEGKVFINGKNIKKDLETIRNDLGLCPQENMVFPDLNVFEQIEFFGLLKGSWHERKQIKQNVNILLSKLKLSDKRNVLPSKLSGGQKRRLCLGMALIGNASTLILDEPTSGMDPETRRDTWDIILKMRGKNTILISTHNMEEADILGDRIAIVHEGRLKCYGTSMFLKKQYGQGHVEVTLSTKSWCNSEKIVNKFDGKTQPIHIDSEKMVLSVPYTDSFPDSLDKIESQKKKLGITGVSVSLITLEQVFLKVVKKEDNTKYLGDMGASQLQKGTQCKLCIETALALFDKKATYTKKNPCNTLLIILFPLLSVFLMALSYNIPADSTDIFPISLDMYNSPTALYSSHNETIGDKYRAIIEHFGGTVEQVDSDISLTTALLNSSIENIAEYRNNFITSAEFNITNNILHANGFYSGIAMHSIPLTVNLLTNSILKYLVGDEFSISILRQPLPNTLISMELILPEIESLSRVLVFCSFFFPTISLFVLHPLQETTTKVKQLQRMTGVTSVSYWSTMFAFDFLIFVVSVLFIILGFYLMDVILDIRLYYQTEILTMILLLILFGINALLLAYIFSFMNKSRSTVMTILSLLPLGLVIVQYLFHQVIYSFDNLKWLHAFQKRLFRFIPHISFFHGQYAFFNIAVQNARCRRIPDRLLTVGCADLFRSVQDVCCTLECSNGTCQKPLPYFKNFEDDINIEECVVYLSITPIIYFAVLILFEEKIISGLIAKLKRPKLNSDCNTMDEQVKKEKHTVAFEITKIINQDLISNTQQTEIETGDQSDLSQTPGNENINLFLVYELSKYYGKLMAVKEVSFRVKQRECFGLLGVNGAGKSTTFRMLTGEEMPNSGRMYLGHAEIHANRRNYLAKMGYCPQTDALLNSLNAFDHLRLFARLRGIPKSNVELEVNKWINRLDLNACMSQPSGTYSGGNKRRLNIAMALIGNPTLVLLDEPTTGVDPAARRSLWNVLQSCQAAGQAIILTSHSMEECEALCNRLVIMVKGQLVCIGASQELKQRFGAGYDIHVKLNPGRTDEDVEHIKRYIESSLTCEIRDENLGFMSYHVTDNETTWKKMYSTMNEVKSRYNCIEDFSVLSATLEQLFLQFARGTETCKREDSPRHSTSHTVIV